MTFIYLNALPVLYFLLYKIQKAKPLSFISFIFLKYDLKQNYKQQKITRYIK